MQKFIKPIQNLLKHRGFSLVETIMSLGIITALGVGTLIIIENQEKAAKGTRAMGEFQDRLNGLRSALNSPDTCDINFKDKAVGANYALPEIKDSNGNVLMKVGEKFNQGYTLTGISIGNHDSKKLRTSIYFDFKKDSQNLRAPDVKRSLLAFTEVAGGKISKCLDPIELNHRGLLFKMCLDADPLQQKDCEKTLENLIHEAKMNYCLNHDFLSWDNANKKCIATKSQTCASGYVQGFTAEGKFVCLNI